MSTEPSIFTRIISREIPAEIIYEDEYTIAFLTIGPVTKGHTLVVPKEAIVNILDGEVTVFGHMMATAQKVARAMIAAGFGEGVNLYMNNGEAAGQEVFHAHLHVIPRRAGDGAIKIPINLQYSEGEATMVSKQITNHLK
ncbi:MAG: hypothetical protein RLZZ360_590 [Candidatus Parcubacteria bacterium]|jgi:histidine triad (HIT) family protein